MFHLTKFARLKTLKTIVASRWNHTDSMLNVKYFILPDQKFIEIQGSDSKKFLQGLCTNDLYKLKKRGDCISAQFLSAKGRIQGEGFLYDTTNLQGYESVLIETNSKIFKDLARLITTYKLRSKIEVTYPKIQMDPRIYSKPENSSSTKEIFNTFYGFGLRLLFAPDVSPQKSLSSLTSSLHSSDSNNSSSYGSSGRPINLIAGTESEYQAMRLMLGLAEGAELQDRIPLEFNADILNHICFTKGCYLGQELTARTKYKGLVRKRVVPFSVTPLPPSYGQGKFPLFQVASPPTWKPVDVAESPLLQGELHLKGTVGGDGGNGDTPAPSKSMGEVIQFNRDCGLGLALTRLEALHDNPNTTASSPGAPSELVAEGPNSKAIPIYPFRPLWWPEIDEELGQPLLTTSPE